MQRSILFAGVLLGAGTFVVDALLPLSYDVGTLYVLVILLGLWVRSPRYPLLAAALATGLLIADTAIGWEVTPARSTYANRPLMTLLFWVTAALVVRFRRLEAASAAQVTRLQELTNALDQAAIVATTDVRGRITYANDKFCEISKYTREELLGQDHRLINSGLHSKEFIRDLWHTITGGTVWHGEIRNRAKDGSYYWVDTTIVPFVGPGGAPHQYVAIRHDITERKLAEERLRHQEALARVGQLAAMVAHEVKNPLAGIKGVLQVLMARRPSGDAEVEIMGEIVDRVDALNELISDLLVFARPRAPRMQLVELQHLLSEAIAMVRKDPIGEHVTTVIEGPQVRLVGDDTMLRSAFSNLVLNAAQAMHGAGTIRLTLTVDAGTCTITVADTGPGIAAEIRDQVFQPFFTTKSRGGGLGLAITQRSIGLHGGTIALVCPPEGGTHVIVTLPLQSATPVAAA